MNRYALMIKTGWEIKTNEQWENCMISIEHKLKSSDFPVEDVFRIPTTASFLFNTDEEGLKVVEEHFAEQGKVHLLP